MSSAYANALSVSLRPSRLLALAIGAIHLGAIISLWILPVTRWLAASLSFALAAHAAYAMARYALLTSPQAIVVLRVGEDLAWRRIGSDEWQSVHVKSLFVHPLAVILLAKARGRRAQSVIVLPDSLDGETFSRLRARLNQLRLKPKPARNEVIG